jgi:hypothetical protein
MFLNLKKCVKIKIAGFSNAKNQTQTHIQRTSNFLLKNQNQNLLSLIKKKNLTTVIITIQQFASKEVGNGVMYEGVLCDDGGKSVSGR